MDLKAVATEIPFFLEKEGDGLDGVFSVILDAMRIKLNFSLLTVGNMEYGKLFSNKNGSGILGSLIRNETQFSVVPMFVTENGVKWFDYTSIIHRQDWSIVSGPPQIYLTDYFSSLRSFETSLWMTLLSVLFLYALLWTVITQFLKQRWNGWDFVKSFGNNLFSSAMVLVNKYPNDKRNRLYERLCWISWTIACMLLSLSFTGLLLAKLAKKNDPFRYETLADILQDPNMKLLLVENTPPYNDIKASNDPTKIQIWNKVNQEKTIIKLEDIKYLVVFQDITLGKLAVMAPIKEFVIGCAEICGMFTDVYISKKPYSVTMFTLYMNKETDFEIRKTIKYVSQQITESHIMKIKMNFLESRGRFCIMPITPEISPLSLEKYYFILLTYILIVTCALSCLIAEFTLSPSPSTYRRRRAN